MYDRYDSSKADNMLVGNFWEISHTMRNISEGKGSQKRILMILHQDSEITQSELTELLGIQPGSVSEVLGKLEAAGLIVRTPSEIDRRTMDITLTEAGKAAAEDAYIKRTERHEQMFAVLSKEEKETLLYLLEKLNTDWNKKYRQIADESSSINCRKGRGNHHKRHEEK